jgi:hypothetical protein
MRRRLTWSLVTAVAFLSVLSLVGRTLAPARANPLPAFAYPVDSSPFGSSYGDWAARWWEYVYAIPAAQNPILDTTGANAGVGQSGPVFFLVETFGGTATRSATVPAGKALFFPVANAEFDTVGTAPFKFPNANFGQLHHFVGATPDTNVLFGEANSFVDTASDLVCQVDSLDVPDLATYRVQSPVFAYYLPPNNVYGALGLKVVPGTVSPAVTAGIYVMLRPLTAGQHTVNFSGSFFGGTFSVGANYTLTVESP